MGRDGVSHVDFALHYHRTCMEKLIHWFSVRFAKNDLIIAQMGSYESVIIIVTHVAQGCLSLLTHHTESMSYESVSVLSYGML